MSLYSLKLTGTALKLGKPFVTTMDIVGSIEFFVPDDKTAEMVSNPLIQGQMLMTGSKDLTGVVDRYDEDAEFYPGMTVISKRWRPWKKFSLVSEGAAIKWEINK